MTEATTREVEGAPGTLPMYLKAALPVLPGVSRLPGVKKSGDVLPKLTLTRHDVPVDRAHVTAYSEVCGFGLRDSLPLTYPHLLAFPLHLALMTDGAFPFPAIGLVHVENSVTAHRAISADERLQVTVRPQNLRPHAKGRVFDIVTTVYSGGELVWEETSTMLRRGRPSDDADDADTATDPAERPGPAGRGTTFEQVEQSGAPWKLAGDLGRRYGSVSGDRNPIHLYGATAKAFGFPRQIAHGMWSKARCLAALQGRLPDAVTVDVEFKKPILLPGTVAFGARADRARADRDDTDHDSNRPGYVFSLTSPDGGAPHLLGRTSSG